MEILNGRDFYDHRSFADSIVFTNMTGSLHDGEGSDGSLKHCVVECPNPPLQVKPLISLTWVSTIEPSRFWTLTKDEVVEGRRRRRVSDLATFATFHPGWVGAVHILSFDRNQDLTSSECNTGQR